MRFLLLLFGLIVTGPPAALAADALPAAFFFPVMPLGSAPDALPQFIPLAANQRLDGAHPGVKRAIVAIHDETRDATSALTMLSTLAGELNATTLIIAPQFLVPSDIVRFADQLPEKGRAFAAWQISGWGRGDESMPVSGRKSISSFAVVDLLLMYVSDKDHFPDLDTIVLAGFGEGANFVQRYAAFNLASDVLDKQGLTVRYVVAAAGNYLYQTPTRFMGTKKGFGIPENADCPDYHAYPFGVDKLNAYARRRGANAAKVDYATRSITYLNAKGPDPMPESSCAALVQGISGAERAERYRLYLHTVYGDDAARTQIFALAKDGKNDAAFLYGSPCGVTALFGDGLCPASYGRVQ